VLTQQSALRSVDPLNKSQAKHKPAAGIAGRAKKIVKEIKLVKNREFFLKDENLFERTELTTMVKSSDPVSSLRVHTLTGCVAL